MGVAIHLLTTTSQLSRPAAIRAHVAIDAALLSKASSTCLLRRAMLPVHFKVSNVIDHDFIDALHVLRHFLEERLQVDELIHPLDTNVYSRRQDADIATFPNSGSWLNLLRA